MDYEKLRDETAANLIAKFGRAAVLRKTGNATYDPSTGKNTVVPQDTPVKVIEIALKKALKGRELSQYSEEQVRHWDSGLVMSAKETAAAGVEPEDGDQILLDGKPARIALLTPVRPAGEAIIYTLAISRR